MTLHLIKWKDERGHIQTFRLVDRVSASWRSFGILLNITTNQLNVWEDQYRGDANMCWARVMEEWLNGSRETDYPVTWEGLYSLLNDAEYSKVAVELRRAVNGADYTAEDEHLDVEDLDTTSPNGQNSAAVVIEKDTISCGDSCMPI